VSTEPLGDPLELRVLSGARPSIETSRGKLLRGGFSATVAPADEITFVIPG
jgi:hypothetical protein